MVMVMALMVMMMTTTTMMMMMMVVLIRIDKPARLIIRLLLPPKLQLVFLESPDALEVMLVLGSTIGTGVATASN